MRAIVFDQHSPDLDAYRLAADIPAPTPGPEEVLVRVAYAALNRLDNFVRIGWKGLDLKLPHIPCSDFSGMIVDVGAAVQHWRAGQQVTANPLIWCGACRACLRGDQNRCRTGHLLGEHVAGTCAEYVIVPARNLVEIPPGYDLRQAAAASLVYVTAWHNLIVAGGLQAGERVLIVGAGGGVNTAAIQIAKLAGAQVYVIASSAAKAEKARALGADWTYDRSVAPDWGKAIFQTTAREGVDMVVDNVGQATWPTSLRALRPGGRLVTVGGTSGYAATVPVNLIFARHLRIIGSTMGAQDDYLRAMDLIFRGKLQPAVDSVYPMSAFRDAMEHMLADEQFGKILISVDSG
jgi:NADPH:quinone reductase-like Zn-dependent oxidoreductase